MITKATFSRLFADWNAMRLLRLILALFIGFQALQGHDVLAGSIAAFFLFQAVTNTGCCGAQGCAVPPTKNGSVEERVTWQEVKPDEIKKTNSNL